MNYFEEDPIPHLKKSKLQNYKKSQYPGQRLLVFLLFLGAIHSIALRMNLSIAVVDMTSNKTITLKNGTTQYVEFLWDSKTKGLVISSFYYGFLLTPIGGYISEKWGGIRAYGIGLFLTAILTVLTPINLRLNLYWFIFCRIIEGITETLCYTSIIDIWSKWSAREDRSKFISITLTGFSVGSFVTPPICGYIGHEVGWPVIFYATGGATIVWYIAWISFAQNEPQSQHSYVQKVEEKKVPYLSKKMITSKPVLALCVAKFTHGWAFTLILICLPLYVKDILNVNTKENGILSGLPNIVSAVLLPVIGYSIDLVMNKKWMTPTHTHKLFNTIGFFGCAVVIIVIVLTKNFLLIMIYLTLFKVFTTINSVVVQCMPLYIAPKCPSIVSGISGVLYTLGSLILPHYIGFVVTKNTSTQWGIIFVSTGVIMILGGIIFLLFSSSEPQCWGMRHEKTDHKHRSNHESFKLPTSREINQ